MFFLKTIIKGKIFYDKPQRPTKHRKPVYAFHPRRMSQQAQSGGSHRRLGRHPEQIHRQPGSGIRPAARHQFGTRLHPDAQRHKIHRKRFPDGRTLAANVCRKRQKHPKFLPGQGRNGRRHQQQPDVLRHRRLFLPLSRHPDTKHHFSGQSAAAIQQPGHRHLLLRAEGKGRDCPCRQKH